MTAIRALVVGIDQYRYPGWNVDGPVSAALSVAHWLLGLKNISLKLDVFLSPDVEIDKGLQEAATLSRLQLHRSTTQADFRTFVRKQLHNEVAEGTKLFVYWCGHGVTCGATNDRILMCEDFDEDMEDCIFNASEFLRVLRTQKYSVFDSQFLVVDACGNFGSKHKFHSEELAQLPTEQLAYFASQPGEYANSPAGQGVFTETVLKILGEFSGYPTDLEVVDERLDAAFRAVLSEPFSITSLGKKGERILSQVGLPPENPRITRVYASALKLVGKLDIVASTCRGHYERTVADFGMPAVASANDVSGMLKDLCGMGIRLSAGDTSEALLQFMERLAAIPELCKPITSWLDAEAPSKNNTRKAIRQKLGLEQLSKTLLIVVRDQSGEIVAMRPYLCLWDGSLDQSYRHAEVLCAGWGAFVSAVQAMLEHFVVEGRLSNLQIQFAVEPFLMDRPFHQIQVKSTGRDLGSMAPVVLRHRSRLQSRDQQWHNDWVKYTHTLRSKVTGDVPWLRVDLAKELPEDMGLCFAGFTLPHAIANTASSTSQKEVLWRLMQLGAPVVYVRHSDPKSGNWEDVQHSLKTMSAASPHFDAFVHIFYRARLGQNLDASHATLLWDDPAFNPFSFLLHDDSTQRH